MMRTRKSGPQIIDKDISDFEREYDLKLPTSYREFILARNGGNPERDLFLVPGCKASPSARIHFFFGIRHPIESYRLEENLKAFSDRIPSWLLPIGCMEGLDLICLGVSGPHRGAVVFWDGYDANEQSFFIVANQFEAFLEQLFVDENSPAVNGAWADAAQSILN